MTVGGFCASGAYYLWWETGEWDWATYFGMLYLAAMVILAIGVPCGLISLGSRWRGYAKRWKRIVGKCATATGVLWVGGLAALMLL